MKLNSIFTMCTVSSIALAGCAIGQTSNGDDILGVRLSAVRDGAAISSAFLPFPWDLIAAAAGSALAGGYIVKRRNGNANTNGPTSKRAKP